MRKRPVRYGTDTWSVASLLGARREAGSCGGNFFAGDDGDGDSPRAWYQSQHAVCLAQEVSGAGRLSGDVARTEFCAGNGEA